ncbi:Manganese/iron superoxide dismutase [Lipomyces tetrasporus]|uniref:Manganese/iron superoxide dismutase n=1 Tax=Lipomyces tetrasporus TaxID=54092 RepID=A0AAD7QXM8_9ASCO|nr:Manganese/iron superoxide dismutase [Lipomyces tetrasporus]KAJ8103275.1 Manganese/iron superoxide dismutase [Lipomyces tetrasporus]
MTKRQCISLFSAIASKSRAIARPSVGKSTRSIASTTVSRSVLSASLSSSRCPRIVTVVSSLTKSSSRSLYSAPKLENQDYYLENGIPPFMTKETFNLAWVGYQEYLAKELTKRTRETRFSSMTPFKIVVATALHADQAALFNFASLTHNNHFFFDSLRGPDAPADTTEPLPAVFNAIEESFTNVEELKAHMSGIAEAMCGNGYVWLLQSPKKRLYVTATYNAGTPYGVEHAQDFDFNSPFSRSRLSNVAQRQQNLLDREDAIEGKPMPLLCINVWQHMYLNDYGFGGKAKYFENWWNSIDWLKVEARLNAVSANSFRARDRQLL